MGISNENIMGITIWGTVLKKGDEENRAHEIERMCIVCDEAFNPNIWLIEAVLLLT